MLPDGSIVVSLMTFPQLRQPFDVEKHEAILVLGDLEKI
jgi:hypothetical protein